MKILVVDDSSTMRRIISNNLRKVGQEDIIEAADGIEGLQCVDEHADLGLILTDWNMPNMNGLEFLKAVQERNKEIPVIMVTTEAEKANVVTAIKAGARNYIVKPFTPDVLKEKLAPWL